MKNILLTLIAAIVGLGVHAQCSCTGVPELQILNYTDDEFCVEIYDATASSTGCPIVPNSSASYCTRVSIAPNSTGCVTICNYIAEIKVFSSPISSSCKKCSPYYPSQMEFSASYSSGGSTGTIDGCFTGYTRNIDFYGCSTCGTPPEYNFDNMWTLEITP